jgi:hypothetical protein
MRPASAGLIAGLSMAAPTVHAAQGSYVYSHTRASCADRSREGFGRWRCPGPAGVAEYTDEGNIAGIALGIRHGNSDPRQA